VLAAGIAALPLVLLVAYSAGNRYNADRDRAKTRAAARSQLLATLIAESPRTPTQADVARLLPLPPIVPGSVIEVFARDGNVVASGGPEKALLPGDDSQIAAALAQPGQTVDVKGADGVKRVWGFATVDGKPLVVAYAIPGRAVYGPAQHALTRDVFLSFGAAAIALLAAFLLGGHLTAPIRRLAARVGHEDDDVHDIGAIERGVDRMGETIEETQIELARRAERLQLVLDQRNQANEELRHLNDELEHRVAERTAQLEEANYELEAFSYSVSHDLRAPLRAIDGFSRILVDEHSEGLSVDAQRYVGLVRRNTLQMGELIDGLLTFAHLGHQPLDKRTIDVEVLAQELVAAELAQRNGHALEIDVGPLPPAQADPTLLRQVYANLLSNAVKYSASSEPARIELGSLPDGERTVYFVKDNGVGFDMRYSDKLFEVFQRLHSDGYDGSGLGLALTARIVGRHGGAIWAESAPGDGATFYFTLAGGPLEPADH
jgi:signal transduction histidine kinase